MRDLIAEHVLWCRSAGLADATITMRRQILGRLVAALGPLEGITASGVTEWAAGLDVSVTARAAYLSQLRSFWRWAEAAGHLDDIGRRLPIPRAPRRLPRPLDVEAIRTAIALAPRPISTWIILGAYAGLRCAEIADLRGDDLRGGWLYVIGKGGHQRMVPAHHVVVAELADYPPSGRLWATSAKQVSRRGSQWLRQLGAGGTMHQLRHTFATEVYSQRSDLLVTQQLLGHASPATTAVYARVASASLRQAVDSLR